MKSGNAKHQHYDDNLRARLSHATATYMATKGMASKYTLHRPNHKKESYAYEQWISGKHHAKLTSFITVSFRLSSFSASVKESLFIKYQQQIDMKMHQTHVQSLFI